MSELNVKVGGRYLREDGIVATVLARSHGRFLTDVPYGATNHATYNYGDGKAYSSGGDDPANFRRVWPDWIVPPKLDVVQTRNRFGYKVIDNGKVFAESEKEKFETATEAQLAGMKNWPGVVPRNVPELVDPFNLDIRIKGGTVVVAPVKADAVKAVHADLMLQYAEDASKRADPWVLWEYKGTTNKWSPLISNPLWMPNLHYRRKSAVSLKPETKAPNYGAPYWVPHLLTESGYIRYIWTGCRQDLVYLERGFVYLSAGDAQRVTRELLDLKKQAEI